MKRRKHIFQISVLLVSPVLLHAQASNWSFTKLATLGVPAQLKAPPAGPAFHINDFEPGAINNRGDVVYGTDLGTSADPSSFFGEGVFLLPRGRLVPLDLAHALGIAPPTNHAGVFDFLLQGQITLNDPGDAAFAFTLNPFGSPITAGDFILAFTNSGLYRYSSTTGNVSALVTPGVTPSPAGGTFPGVGFNTSINNRGDTVFPGIVGTKTGVFKADAAGNITAIAKPGDPMPDGRIFDSAMNSGPWINQAGDIAFTAQLVGEAAGSSSIYVRDARTGAISPIVRQGGPRPEGGAFNGLFSPVLNESGDIVFEGNLTPGGPSSGFGTLGVYLYSKGVTRSIAKPGDPMPGGGNFSSASFFVSGEVDINASREVVFSALLDSDTNGDGRADTGLYVWSKGEVRLIARSGTILPGVGTVRDLATNVSGFPPPPIFTPSSGALNNDRGQVLFAATLIDGSAVLVLATPH
jgi:hypothetical protein